MHSYISLLRALACPRDPYRLDGIRRLPQARCIEKRHRKPTEIHPDLDHVPRRAWHVGDDCRLASRQVIEQGRFAHVRCTDDGDLKPVPDAFRRDDTVHFDLYRLPTAFEGRGNLRRDIDRHVLFGEIDHGLEQSHGPQQVSLPLIGLSAKPTGHHPHRLPPLRFGFGIDEIGQPLDLR